MSPYDFDCVALRGVTMETPHEASSVVISAFGSGCRNNGHHAKRPVVSRLPPTYRYGVNAVDAPIVIGAYRLPMSPAIMASDADAERAASSGSFSMDPILFGKRTD
jgi:hypothetical protein